MIDFSKIVELYIDNKKVSSLSLDGHEIDLSGDSQLSCFTFENLDSMDSQTISLQWQNTASLEFSMDGTTWADLAYSQTMTVAPLGKVFIRHKSGYASNFTRMALANTSKNYKVYGSMKSLVPEGAESSLPAYAFADMFREDKNIVDASGLLLDCMGERCYDWAFAYCSNLSAGPQFCEFESLSSYCYTILFYNCGRMQSVGMIPDFRYSSSSHPFYETFLGCNGLSALSVQFDSWTDENGQLPFYKWCYGMQNNCTLYCPAALGTDATIQRGENYCPNGWTVVNYDAT